MPDVTTRVYRGRYLPEEAYKLPNGTKFLFIPDRTRGSVLTEWNSPTLYEMMFGTPVMMFVPGIFRPRG
jgi:hypothetical protein